MPSFPHKVWDGLTTTRSSLDSVQPPGYRDWLALLSELQATQEFVLKLAKNVEVLPDLDGQLASAKTRLDKLRETAEHLAVPEDLRAEVQALAARVDKTDVKESHEALRRGVKMLLTRLKAIEAGHRELKKDIYYQLKVFANQMRNQLAEIVTEQEKQGSRLQGQINELQALLKDPDLG